MMFQALLLRAQCDEISTVHLQSNEHDLSVMILFYAFHQNRWSKIKSSIWRLCPICPINWDVLRRCKAFLGFSSNQIFKTPQSLNLLLPIASRSISASTECLKVRFRWENRDKSILECQQLSSNSRNEKPLIRREIGSIRALSWVKKSCFFPILSSYKIIF